MIVWAAARWAALICSSGRGPRRSWGILSFFKVCTYGKIFAQLAGKIKRNGGVPA
jgi:hypothetical protein